MIEIEKAIHRKPTPPLTLRAQLKASLLPQSNECAQKHAIAREKVSARLKTALNGGTYGLEPRHSEVSCQSSF